MSFMSHFRTPSMTPGPAKLSLAGHEGYLTPEQERSLAEFKKLAADAGIYRPSDPGMGGRPSHSDTALLRYLRARQFSPQRALKQFSDAERWLKDEVDMEHLYPLFPVQEFADTRKFYPMWCGRRDRTGYPIHVYKLSALDAKLMKELDDVPVERRYQRISALYQLLISATIPLCAALPSEVSPNMTTPPDGTCTLVDLEGVSLGLMWSLRTHLQQASGLANANFPETMGMTFIVNAPSFFSTVWGWLKVWFDEHTRNKIHVLSSAKSPSTRNSLFEQIDPSSLPKAYGGTLDWEFGDAPNLEEGMKDVLKRGGVDDGRFPDGPWALVEGEGGRKQVLRGREILEERERLLGGASGASGSGPNGGP